MDGWMDHRWMDG